MSAPGVRFSRPTHGTQKWPGPRRSPEPAEEQPGSPVCPGPPRRRSDGARMFTQLLGAVATVYGVLGALKALLQTRQMLAHRTSRGVSARFLASYTGGYAIWLAYGLSTGSIPLIVVDTIGLLCGGLTLAVALSLRSPTPMPRATQSHD